MNDKRGNNDIHFVKKHSVGSLIRPSKTIASITLANDFKML